MTGRIDTIDAAWLMEQLPSLMDRIESAEVALKFYAKDPIFVSAKGNLFEKYTDDIADLRKARVGRTARDYFKRWEDQPDDR